MEQVKQHSGSVVGGALLITGSCVGAGMLGLPVLTGMAGFIPTTLMLIISCLFMTSTGLLLVEVNQWFKGRTNFITMVASLLGPVGRIACWLLYLFLFYALLVAYTAGSGHHVASLLMNKVPAWVGSIFFVGLFGWVIYLGTRSVDFVNRGLMVGKIAAFIALIVVALGYVKGSMLLHTQMEYAFFSLPILIISFGFQNMIPTLSHYFNGDTKKVKQSILIGSSFTLVIYLLWEIISLGILPIQGPNGILESYKTGTDAAQTLRFFLQKPWIGVLASALAFFALLTSFLAQSLSIVHFLSDGMKVKVKKRENVWICLLALLPPLIFAIINPAIFYKAINFAGGVCAVIIFGVFPVLMIWIGRYKRGYSDPYTVSGGKHLLVVLMGISVFILFYQLSNMFGLEIFPKPI